MRYFLTENGVVDIPFDDATLFKHMYYENTWDSVNALGYHEWEAWSELLDLPNVLVADKSRLTLGQTTILCASHFTSAFSLLVIGDITRNREHKGKMLIITNIAYRKGHIVEGLIFESGLGDAWIRVKLLDDLIPTL